MNRRLGFSIVVAGLLVGSLPHANGTDAASGTIEGTVKATGLPSNADAIVSILQVPDALAPSAPIEMDQRKMQFTPRVLPIVTGSTVRFVNSDPTPHSVFSPDHEKYTLGILPEGVAKEQRFAQCAKPPCSYVQLCRLHPDMEGFIVVLQNPFFAKTDQDGHYKIENVPAGTYSLAVWHETEKAQPKPVTIDAGKSAVVNFDLAK